MTEVGKYLFGILEAWNPEFQNPGFQNSRIPRFQDSKKHQT
jgi:hypothetical protein